MTAIGEKILAALRDTYLFSYFTGSVEELSSDQLIQVYLRLLNVFDSNYDLESSDGNQPHEQNVSASSALKHIIRCLRSMELFHLVGSSKPSQLYDKKTSLRLLSALHDKITARYTSKTAHRVRIVVKADKLARRERKKPLQDLLSAPDDATAPKRQDKENLDSCLTKCASLGIPATLEIEKKVDVDDWETRSECNRTSAPVSSEEILKEVDTGAGYPLKTEELPALLVPKKGRELARTPARPQTSTDKECRDEDSGDSVSSPPILMEASASPAHLHTDSTTAGTRVPSSKQKPTMSDPKVPKHFGYIANDLSQPSTKLNDIPSVSQVGEFKTQPQSSAVFPMAQTFCLPTNLANVRNISVPILSGANVLQPPLTPVSMSVLEDRNVIPSGRQITRTPVATPLEDDSSLEDSSLTPAMKDEMSDVSVLLKTEHVHLIQINNDRTVEGKSCRDSNETSSPKRLGVQPHQTDYDSSFVDENSYSITAGFRVKASVDVTSPSDPVADPTLCVKNDHLVCNTLIGLPIVNKLVTRQDKSPRFIPLPADKGERPSGHCTIPSVDSADAKDVAINNGVAKVDPCQSEMGSNSMLSSADEKDTTASPSVCRDPPLLKNDTLKGATERCSSSVNLETIILKPPPGFDSSCPDRGEDEVNSLSDISEPLAIGTCIETQQKNSSVSLVENESSGHLAVLKCIKGKTYNLEATKKYEDLRKTLEVSKAVLDSDSKKKLATFVLPKDMICVNTHECKKQTSAVSPNEMASNTLIVQANESRELMPSPGMSAVAFGELTFLPKNVGETFLVDRSGSSPQECCTGQLALSSTEEESSCYSIKYPRSDCEGSEEGSDAPSTPPSHGRDPGNVNYVPRGRQLYRTPVKGLSKNEVTSGIERSDNGSSQASENDLQKQALENRNELAGEGLLSPSEFSAENEVGMQNNVETLGVEMEENNLVEKSVMHEKVAEAMVKVSSVTLEKDLTCSVLVETLSEESLLKPVKFDLCKNETYVKDSTIMGQGVHVADELMNEAVVDVNNVKKSVVQDMEDSCDLDDFNDIFKLVKNKQVKRNLPVEKLSHSAGNKGVKRSRKGSIEHLLIKLMNAEHLLSPINSGNGHTGHSVCNTKKESSPSEPKRGRKKMNVNAATGKKKSKTLVKAEQTDALIASDIHSISDPEVEMDSKEGTSATPLTRGVEWNEECVNFPRPPRGIETAQPTNPAPTSVLDGNEGSKEVFDQLEANQSSRKRTKGEKMVGNRKGAHTYSKKTKREQTKASITKGSLSKLTKKHSCDEMIAEPQTSIESDDLINELPENSMRRPRRQRGTKVVDYNESPPVTPSLPPSRGRKGRPAKHSQGTHKGGASVHLDTHKPAQILDTPQPVFEMLATTTGNRDNFECSNDDFHHTVSANEADDIVPQDISGRDCGESNDFVDSKKPSRRGRGRGRGGRNGPSPVMSATKSNAVSRGRSSKQNVLVTTSDAPDVPETVSREASSAKGDVKTPALRACAVTISSKGGKKIAAASSKTRKEGIATALPGECIPEVLAPAVKNRSGASRGRVRTAAERATQPIASKSRQLIALDGENCDIFKEGLESEHAKVNSRDKASFSAKKVPGDKVSAHTKAVKNKRSAESVNKVKLQLSSSPGLPDDPQNVNKKHDTTGEILPEKLSRRGKSAIIKEGKEIETSDAAKTKKNGTQRKRAPAISKSKPAIKGKVLESASAEVESEFVDAKTFSAGPKRKWKGTNQEEHDDIYKESLNKKVREDSLNGSPVEPIDAIAKEVSSREASGMKANRAKAPSVKSSRKVNFENSADTSTVKRRGSKSKVGTEDEPASKPRATRARGGKAAAT